MTYRYKCSYFKNKGIRKQSFSYINPLPCQTKKELIANKQYSYMTVGVARTLSKLSRPNRYPDQ